MTREIAVTQTDVQHANLLSALKALKEARVRVEEAHAALRLHEGTLSLAEGVVRSTLRKLGEDQVVLGDDLIELVDTPNGTAVQVTPVLVLP